jgi:hypothetical protein
MDSFLGHRLSVLYFKIDISRFRNLAADPLSVFFSTGTGTYSLIINGSRLPLPKKTTGTGMRSHFHSPGSGHLRDFLFKFKFLMAYRLYVFRFFLKQSLINLFQSKNKFSMRKLKKTSFSYAQVFLGFIFNILPLAYCRNF